MRKATFTKSKNPPDKYHQTSTRQTVTSNNTTTSKLLKNTSSSTKISKFSCSSSTGSSVINNATVVKSVKSKNLNLVNISSRPVRRVREQSMEKKMSATTSRPINNLKTRTPSTGTGTSSKKSGTSLSIGHAARNSKTLKNSDSTTQPKENKKSNYTLYTFLRDKSNVFRSNISNSISSISNVSEKIITTKTDENKAKRVKPNPNPGNPASTTTTKTKVNVNAKTKPDYSRSVTMHNSANKLGTGMTSSANKIKIRKGVGVNDNSTTVTKNHFYGKIPKIVKVRVQSGTQTDPIVLLQEKECNSTEKQTQTSTNDSAISLQENEYENGYENENENLLSENTSLKNQITALNLLVNEANLAITKSNESNQTLIAENSRQKSDLQKLKTNIDLLDNAFSIETAKTEKEFLKEIDVREDCIFKLKEIIENYEKVGVEKDGKLAEMENKMEKLEKMENLYENLVKVYENQKIKMGEMDQEMVLLEKKTSKIQKIQDERDLYMTCLEENKKQLEIVTTERDELLNNFDRHLEITLLQRLEAEMENMRSVIIAENKKKTSSREFSCQVQVQDVHPHDVDPQQPQVKDLEITSLKEVLKIKTEENKQLTQKIDTFKTDLSNLPTLKTKNSELESLNSQLKEETIEQKNRCKKLKFDYEGLLEEYRIKVESLKNSEKMIEGLKFKLAAWNFDKKVVNNYNMDNFYGQRQMGTGSGPGGQTGQPGRDDRQAVRRADTLPNTFQRSGSHHSTFTVSPTQSNERFLPMSLERTHSNISSADSMRHRQISETEKNKQNPVQIMNNVSVNLSCYSNSNSFIINNMNNTNNKTNTYANTHPNTYQTNIAPTHDSLPLSYHYDKYKEKLRRKSSTQEGARDQDQNGGRPRLGLGTRSLTGIGGKNERKILVNRTNNRPVLARSNTMKTNGSRNNNYEEVVFKNGWA